MRDETWVSVAGYEGIYEVSDLGRVRSVDRVSMSSLRESQAIKGRLLKAGIAGTGYLTVSLCKEGKPRTHTVHELVARAFIGPRPEGADIDHIDSSRRNNLPSNLRYASHEANMRNLTIANSESGVLGVYRNGPGWAAQINYERKQRHLGTFSSIEEAARARRAFEDRVEWRTPIEPA